MTLFSTQKCDNRDNGVTTKSGEDVTAQSRTGVGFHGVVTTVTTSLRDTHAGAHTRTRVRGYLCHNVTQVFYINKINQIERDNLNFLRCNRLSRLSQSVFSVRKLHGR